MKSTGLVQHVLFSIIAYSPFLYMSVIWEQIPSEVATHFNSNLEPDGYTSKSSLPLVIGGICSLGVLCYFLSAGIHKIDPKRVNKPASSLINRLGVVVLIFLTGLNFLLLHSSISPEQNLIDKALGPALGLLFVLLGNYMYRIRPNYFVGIRVPWTLSSDFNWRKTHQLAGVLWFVGGLAWTILYLFLPKQTASVLTQILLAVMVVLPIAYSFILFRNHKSKVGYFDSERPTN